MTISGNKTKTNSAEEFIKRKSEYFKENNILKVKDTSRKVIMFGLEKPGLLCPNLIWMKKCL